MRKNNEKGITLIALVITIIIMLILATVSISIAVNGNLFKYSTKSANDFEKAKIIESAKVDILAKQAENLGGITEDDLIEVLTSNQYSTQGTYFI